MDLQNPIRSVIPSAHGNVLAILARSGKPLSGRGVAELTDGQLSPKGVSLALRSLVTAGIVLVEEHPPAKLYRLNRRHLACKAITSLAELRSSLIGAITAELAGWNQPATAGWVFGSFARGDGGTESDIDVLIVRDNALDDEDSGWTAQIETLVESVRAWSGNACAVIAYSEAEFSQLMASDERLARELRTEAIALTAKGLPSRRPVQTV